MKARNDLQHSTAYWIARLNRAILDELSGRMARHGVTPTQWRVLAAVHDAPGSTPGAIGQRLDVDGASVTRVLDRLEKRRFVERRTDESDRRSVIVDLTPLGREIVPRLANASRSADVWLQKDVDEESLRGFREVLDQMLRRLGKDGVDPSWLE